MVGFLVFVYGNLPLIFLLLFNESTVRIITNTNGLKGRTSHNHVKL